MNEILKIIEFSKKFKRYYFLLIFFVVLISILNQATPLLTKSIVDIIVTKLKYKNTSITPILILLACIFITDITITIITVISQYIGDIFAVKLNTYLSEKYYSHILSLSLDYFDNEIAGKIVNRLDRGINNITDLIQESTNTFIPFIVSTLLTLFIIAIYSWQLAIFLFLLFPIYVYISHKSSVAWRKIEDEKNTVLDQMIGRVFEAISSVRVVKSFLREKVEFESFAIGREKYFAFTKRQSKQWHQYDFYRRFLLNIIMFGIFGYIIFYTFQGIFSIGVMTLLLQLANQAKFPLFAMSYIIGQIQQAQAGSKEFFAALEMPIMINDQPQATVLDKVSGEIEFSDIDFSYKESSQVLNEINFKIKKGEKIALVGESGEGKSTIASLLLRFYEPQKGAITIDGINIQSVTQESLRHNIGVVFQETFLFSGTVLENIQYGKKNTSKQDAMEAAKIANAHDFIEKLPNGYETQIGERGVKLSGGQKQRIAIARALLKNPPILIFDEATSSLDSKSEFEVQKALNKLMEGRTTIITAHRLSTIKNVDAIVVIKNGKIIEKGTPAQLEKINGVYAELLSYQNITPENEDELQALDIYIS